MNFPRPCAYPFFQNPSYTLPSAWIKRPNPLAKSSAHYPIYLESSSQMNIPYPLFLPDESNSPIKVPSLERMGPVIEI